MRMCDLIPVCFKFTFSILMVIVIYQRSLFQKIEMQMIIEFKGHQGDYNDELFFLTAHEKST